MYQVLQHWNDVAKPRKMVHEGGPSEGCDTCRARKVKCSLEKPDCHRCKKAGFKCLGYLRRPRAKLKLMSYKLDTPESVAPKLTQSEKCSESPAAVVLALSWPSLDQSTNFFLSQFVIVSIDRPDSGWFDFVPQVIHDHCDCIPLNTAFEAVSLLSLASRYNRRDLMIEALHLNGKALEAVNVALVMPSEAREDGIFAAILLLCLFGHINGDLRLHMSAHATGMFRLLGLRDAAGVCSPHAKTFARHVMLLMHLDNNDQYIPLAAVPERDTLDVQLFESNDLFERLIMLWPHSSAVPTRFRGIPTTGDARKNIRTVLDGLRVWKEFEDALHQTAQNLDLTWLFGTETTSSAHSEGQVSTSSRRVLTYPDSWTMAIWNAYRVTTISLHTVLVKIYTIVSDASLEAVNELQRQCAENMRYRSLAIIDNMNEDICASIPWGLGEIGQDMDTTLPSASRASLSTVGLRTVVNGMHTRQRHLLQARDALDQIAYRFGIKSALEHSRIGCT